MSETALIRLGAGCVLLAAATLGGKPLRRLIRALQARLEKYMPRWLKVLSVGLADPCALLISYGLLAGGLLALPLPVETELMLAVLIPVSRAVLVFLICWGLWRSAPVCQLLVRSVEDAVEVDSGKTIGRFFENIYKAVVALFAVLSGLGLLGLPVGSVIAGAGVAGLAVSLAAQSTLSNLIAGVTLVLERPFALGDFVTLGAVSGTVEDISFRSTRLRTPDNVLITVENAAVCAEYIHNNTRRTSRLWTFDLNLGHETAPEQLKNLTAALETALCEDEGILSDNVQVIVDRLDAAGVVLNVRCYSSTADFGQYRAIKDRLNRRILEVVHQQGCRLAPPAARIYMEENRSVRT